MIKFSVFYPWFQGCWFDSKYYVENHIQPYVKDPLVKGIIVESGNSTRNFQDPPHYACVAHFFYENEADLYASRNPERTASQIADNVNFTNIEGFTLVSEMAYVQMEKLLEVK